MPKPQPMTRKSLLFLVFSAFLSLASAQNLALNMPVTVTSTEGGLVGENAVDGSMSTRWSSAFSEPHSISVDLGDVYDLDRVVIHWEAAFAIAYDVEVSMVQPTGLYFVKVLHNEGDVTLPYLLE